MLKAVVMFHPRPISKQQIATLAGFAMKGGTFQTYLGELKRNGWITTDGDKHIVATEAGIDNAGSVDPLPTDPDAIVEMWAGRFRAGAARMLRAIAEAYPESMTKEDLADTTDFTVSGGTFQTYLGELRRNGLIEVTSGSVTARKELFMED
jgi:DNA-binding IclR family transcriptional regulator